MYMILFVLIIIGCLFGGVNILRGIKDSNKISDAIIAFILIMGAGLLIIIGFNYMVNPYDEMPAKTFKEEIDPNKGATDYSGEYIIEETKDYYVYNSPNGTYKVLK